LDFLATTDCHKTQDPKDFLLFFITLVPFSHQKKFLPLFLNDLYASALITRGFFSPVVKQ